MPDNPKKIYHGGRALLNLLGHQSTAAMVAEVEDTSVWPEGKNRQGRELDSWNAEPDYLLKFANCDRAIAFEIDLDPNEQENTMHKLNTMVDLIVGFRDAVEVEIERYNVREKIARANEEKRKAKEGATPLGQKIAAVEEAIGA